MFIRTTATRLLRGHGTVAPPASPPPPPTPSPYPPFRSGPLPFARRSTPTTSSLCSSLPAPTQARARRLGRGRRAPRPVRCQGMGIGRSTATPRRAGERWQPRHRARRCGRPRRSPAVAAFERAWAHALARWRPRPTSSVAAARRHQRADEPGAEQRRRRAAAGGDRPHDGARARVAPPADAGGARRRRRRRRRPSAARSAPLHAGPADGGAAAARQGGLGLVLSSAVDAASELVVAARGQTMSVAFFLLGLFAFGSEASATKAGPAALPRRARRRPRAIWSCSARRTSTASVSVSPPRLEPRSSPPAFDRPASGVLRRQTSTTSMAR